MLIDVNPALPVPLPVQIASAMREAIGTGSLASGDVVPSSRELASRLGISRGSVVTAYDQLVSEGYLQTRQGAPTRVHPDLGLAFRPASPAPSLTPSDQRGTGSSGGKLGAPRLSLKPSSGHAGTVRPAAWRRAWREAAGDPIPVIDASGQPPLRAAIAEHLRLARGLAVSPDDIVVTGGSREGLLLCLLALSGMKRTRESPVRVGVEDPGHPGLRRVVPAAGCGVVKCRVDHDGVDVSTLPKDLDGLLVTPAYQYPLGASMPAARRSELLAWASETGTVVIEDDFNAELRYRIAPQPPLAALAAGAQVLTLGTFSTLLSRNLSAGYVVAPPELSHVLKEMRSVMGMPVSPVTQLAIAHLLRNGHVRRNTRVVRNRLAARRERLHAELLPAMSRCEVAVTEMAESNGVDLALAFISPAARDCFVAELEHRAVECGRLESLWTGHYDGLIMSFAHLSDDDFDTALAAVVSAAGATAPPLR